MKVAPSYVCFLLAATLQHGSAVDKLKLSSGYEIPAVGLGTGSIKLTSEMDEAIANALEVGYRHFDTAFLYKNEAAIGAALKKWFQKGGKREDLFITSKLPQYGNQPERVERYLKKSLSDLGLEYVDMYLIHSPFGTKEGADFTEGEDDGNIFENADHVALWKKMEEQVTAGRAKSIGLSNFNQSQILNVFNNAEIKPSNLQVESHGYLQQNELRDFCKKYNIVMTAYSPLGSPSARSKIHKGTSKDLQSLTDLPEVKDLAQKYNKTAGQILLRHSVQAGLVVIPKSSNKNRQRENIEVFNFTLSEEDFEKIKGLDKGEKGRVFDFLKFYKGLDKNPQYPFPIVA